MIPTEAQVEAGARAICVAAGDDPDQLTYAREMHCTGNDREPKQRWQYWDDFSRACIAAALALPPAEGNSPETPDIETEHFHYDAATRTLSSK